jgi:hypothetical protein
LYGRPNGAVADHPIDVTRIHVPLTVTIGLFAVVISGVISMTFVWHRVVNHVESTTVHLSEADAVSGGGPAYKAEVRAVRVDLDTQLRVQHQKTRKLLKAMTIDCRKRGEGMACRTELPEEE